MDTSWQSRMLKFSEKLQSFAITFNANAALDRLFCCVVQS